MEVVAVEGIGLGAEHGREVPARRLMNGAQEAALGVTAPPAAAHRHLAPIGQHEGRDVEGVGVAVLGKLGARLAIHRPARIGRGHRDLGQRHAEMALGGRADAARDPAVDLRHHGAPKQRGWFEGDASTVGRRHLERARGATDARPSQR